MDELDALFGELPIDSTDQEQPGRGTTRPHTWIEQPRGKARERLMREERDSDEREQLRIQWLMEVRKFIVRTTRFADHWKDPRWDELPPEWTYDAWRARKIREGRLTPRRIKLT